MGSIPHDLWVHALPRLLAVSYGLAMVAALLIRLTWRRKRSHLSFRPSRRPRRWLIAVPLLLLGCASLLLHARLVAAEHIPLAAGVVWALALSAVAAQV